MLLLWGVKKDGTIIVFGQKEIDKGWTVLRNVQNPKVRVTFSRQRQQKKCVVILQILEVGKFFFFFCKMWSYIYKRILLRRTCIYDVFSVFSKYIICKFKWLFKKKLQNLITCVTRSKWVVKCHSFFFFFFSFFGGREETIKIL